MFNKTVVIGILMVVAVTGCTTPVTSASGNVKTVQGSGRIRLLTRRRGQQLEQSK